MSPTIAVQLRVVPGGHEAYMNSMLFHQIVDTVDSVERQGGDGLEALGQILVTLSKARDATITEMVNRAMREPPNPILVQCATCGRQERLIFKS